MACIDKGSVAWKQPRNHMKENTYHKICNYLGVVGRVAQGQSNIPTIY
jgi:hypothetical protein